MNIRATLSTYATRLRRLLGLAGVESDWLERDVVPALTEEWFTATERRIDLDLARGVSGELLQLTNEYSLRESLWVRLISALHPCRPTG